MTHLFDCPPLVTVGALRFFWSFTHALCAQLRPQSKAREDWYVPGVGAQPTKLRSVFIVPDRFTDLHKLYGPFYGPAQTLRTVLRPHELYGPTLCALRTC